MSMQSGIDPSPRQPVIIRESDIARQLIDLGCHLDGDPAEAERRGEWAFRDAWAADVALYVRATPEQRNFIRTHDWRMQPDPVDTEIERAKNTTKVYSFGSLDGYAYEGDTVDAGGYVTEATGGELHGWGIHAEVLTRAEVTPHADDDPDAADAALVQAGVDCAADHPVPVAGDQPAPMLTVVGQEVGACLDDDSGGQVPLLVEGDDADEYEDEGAPVPAPVQSEQPESARGRKRIEYPIPKHGGPWGPWADFERQRQERKRRKRTPPQPLADPNDANRDPNLPHDSLWLSTEQVARLLGITGNAVRRWAERHKVPHEVRGRSYYYRLEDVRAYANYLAGSTERLEADVGPEAVAVMPESLEELRRHFAPMHAA